MSKQELSYEVWQDDKPVATVDGDYFAEAFHYAMQYGQDGPVKIYKVIREEVYRYRGGRK